MDKDKEIKKLKAEIEKLKKLVIRDELTGVLNRRGLNEELSILFNEAIALNGHRHKRKLHVDDFSIIFIDIDNFKKINDIYGHNVGDLALKKIAAFLRKKMRSIDIVGRFGGEEFAIAMLGASEDDAYKKAKDIKEDIKRDIKFAKYKNLKVTLSVGVASLKESVAKSVLELIVCADKAMYEAKHNRGKDNVVRYSEIS